MKHKNIIIGGVVGVVVLAGVFYGGIQFGQAHTGNRVMGGEFRGDGMQFAQNRQGGRTGGMSVRGGMMAGFIGGEVIAKDLTSMTVKLMDGGSKIIFTSASTTVSKSAEGTLADVSVGSSVVVQGKANSDGSLTASSVQLRPVGGSPIKPQ